MTVSLLALAVSAAADVDVDEMPEEVLRRTQETIADTIGVIVAGARSPEVVALTRQESPRRPQPGAATILTSPPAEAVAERAAFVNATAGTFFELDEGIRPTGHPSIHVLPAALATAETKGSSGGDLLRAYVAGYEVTSRLFHAFRLRYPVHPHGHFGSIGAAVACALLDGVDPLAAARVAATTLLLPVWDACYEGSTVRNTFAGWSAQSAVRSCELVRAGFTGTDRVLERGFGRIAGELVDADALSAPLSYAHLGLMSNYFKRHSACALTHASIDAVFELDLPRADQIDHVLVETVQNNMKIARQPQPNDLSGRFSLPYAIATAIVLGRTDPEAFGYRSDVAEFAQRVHVRVADDLEARWPDESPARVIVSSGAGDLTAVVANPRGHHTDPLTHGEVQEKFTRLVASPGAELWWSRLMSLTSIDDCSGLLTTVSR